MSLLCSLHIFVFYSAKFEIFKCLRQLGFIKPMVTLIVLKGCIWRCYILEQILHSEMQEM